MAEYDAQFLDEASRDFARLDAAIRRRVWKRLQWLRKNLDQITPETLTGALTGLYKLRMGDYRILYEILRNERKIVIHSIGHRRDIYRLP